THLEVPSTSRGTIRSCLHLLNLAWSATVDKSDVTEDRLKEAQYRNKSVSFLGYVISVLGSEQFSNLYRNSKLNLLLQDAL
ncbi:unnamed protein product, partial [Brassica oleracea]